MGKIDLPTRAVAMVRDGVHLRGATEGYTRAASKDKKRASIVVRTSSF